MSKNNNFDPLIFNSKKFCVNLNYIIHHSNELQEFLETTEILSQVTSNDLVTC